MKRRQGISLIFLGILSVIYFIVMNVFGGRISFSEFWCVLGVVLIIIGVLRRSNKENIFNKIPSIYKKIIYGVLIVGFIFFISIEMVLIHAGTVYEKGESDYLLILGAGLRGDRMSLSLYQRMVKSLEYIEENPHTKIILSGGQGPDESISEAEAMKRFLVKHGVDENQIIKEDKSTSTYENLKFTREKLDEIDEREDLRLTIITNNFHMYRAKMLAGREGFTAYGMPAPLHYLITPNYYVRESLAIIKSYIFDKGNNDWIKDISYAIVKNNYDFNDEALKLHKDEAQKLAVYIKKIKKIDKDDMIETPFLNEISFYDGKGNKLFTVRAGMPMIFDDKGQLILEGRGIYKVNMKFYRYLDEMGKKYNYILEF
jgi:uncharacterized SAM-binding protein YcdF (DUF218 family)